MLFISLGIVSILFKHDNERKLINLLILYLSHFKYIIAVFKSITKLIVFKLC